MSTKGAVSQAGGVVKLESARCDGQHLAASSNTGRPPPGETKRNQTNCPPGKHPIQPPTQFCGMDGKSGWTLLIPLSIHNTQVSAVVDTAAQATIMSGELFERIKSSLPETKLSSKQITLQAADGGRMAGHIVTDLLITIGPKVNKWDASVAPINDRMILGLDVLKHLVGNILILVLGGDHLAWSRVILAQKAKVPDDGDVAKEADKRCNQHGSTYEFVHDWFDTLKYLSSMAVSKGCQLDMLNAGSLLQLPW